MTATTSPKGTGRTSAGSARTRKAASGAKGAVTATRPMGALAAAAEVLAAAAEPMTAAELVAAMAERGLWASPNGRTPEATVYAAIVREIASKGSASRLAKHSRGRFVHAGAGR